jgi:hypothetical protein
MAKDVKPSGGACETQSFCAADSDGQSQVVVLAHGMGSDPKGGLISIHVADSEISRCL